MKVEEIYLKSEGNEIIGSIFMLDQPPLARSPVLCICHGIPSGNPPDPNDPGYFQLAQDFCELGLVVLIFNFRGTGLSSGNFDIIGWTKDFFVILDFIWNREEIDRAKIFVMGFSGGAAVAIYCAAQDPRISYVIACASPAEFRLAQNPEQAQAFLKHCCTIGIIRDKDFPLSLDVWADSFKVISPKKWVNRIAPRPLLIIHGEDDDLVNVSHAKTLYEHASDPKEITMIRGAGHRLRLEKEAMTKARGWIRKHLET